MSANLHEFTDPVQEMLHTIISARRGGDNRLPLQILALDGRWTAAEIIGYGLEAIDLYNARRDTEGA